MLKNGQLPPPNLILRNNIVTADLSIRNIVGFPTEKRPSIRFSGVPVTIREPL